MGTLASSDLCASQFQPRASHPRVNPGHMLHDESRGPGIWQLVVSRPPGHLQTAKNLFRNILSSISDGAQSKEFEAVKHCHFGVGEEHLSTKKDL